jgi:ABC-type amino acid transport substrate-binding protein
MFAIKSFMLTVLLIISVNARSIEQIQESGEILIAVYKDFPPYSFRKDGELQGVDVDLGKLLAKSLGVKAKFNEIGADETLSDDLRLVIWKGNLIHKNKSDVMFRVPYDYDYLRITDQYTGELQTEMVSIKAPYQSETFTIATHKDKISELPTLARFAYHTVGVELDTLPDEHLSSFARGLIRHNVKHYFHYKDAVKDFLDGKLDAIVGMRSQVEYYIDYENNKDKYLLTDGIPQYNSKWDLATAVAQEFRPLSYHIDGLIYKEYQNGNLKKLFNKYGVEYQAPIARTQN